jgi:hypothetical protein
VTKSSKAATGRTQGNEKARPVKGRKSDRPQDCPIRMPDARELKNLATDFKLTAAQSKSLKLAIGWVVMDVQTDWLKTSKNPPRKELKARLRTIHNSFERLDRECRKNAALMEEILPYELLRYLAGIMTFSALGAAVGANVFPGPVDFAKWLEPPASIKSLEEASLRHRYRAVSRNGYLAFTNVIGQICAILKEQVDRDRLDKGGRKPNATRALLIQQLARMSLDILGKKASVAKSGKFVSLCSAVLTVCGLSGRGVESVIPGIVTEVRATEAVWAPRLQLFGFGPMSVPSNAK